MAYRLYFGNSVDTFVDPYLDKWYQRQENPVNRKAISGAVLAGALFFVPVLTQPETVTVDKWFQPTQQPNFTVKRQTAGAVRGEFETVTLDKWFRPASEPYFSKKRNYFTGEFRFETPRTILLTDWFQETRQPYFPKRRTLPQGEYRFEVPRTILFSDWWQPAQQPYFSKLRNYHTGEARFEVPRTILISDWWRAASEPVRRIVRREQGFFIKGEIISEDTQLNEWWQPASEPYFPKLRNYRTGEFRFEVPRPPLITDWLQPINQPGKKPIFRQVGGEFRVEIIVPEVTIDSWFMAIVQPYIRRATPVGAHELKIELTVSKEFIQAIFM